MMKTSLILGLAAVLCGGVSAAEPAELPKDVPPVVGTAIVSDDSEAWAVEVSIPKVTWEVVGEERPKVEWPRFKVDVKEAALTLSMAYPRATQMAEHLQNRVVDLKGKRLDRDDALKRLKQKTPVLVSVSGRMPDAFYLQCTKPDTLIVILGIPNSPAPGILPQPRQAAATATEDRRTKK